MTVQTLLLDDYGMFVLSRLRDIWDYVHDVPDRKPESGLMRPAETSLSEDFVTMLNEFMLHMVLLFNSPDIAPQRLEYLPRLLDGQIVKAVINLSLSTAAQQKDANMTTNDSLMMAQAELADEIIQFLNLLRENR